MKIFCRLIPPSPNSLLRGRLCLSTSQNRTVRTPAPPPTPPHTFNKSRDSEGNFLTPKSCLKYLQAKNRELNH